MVRCQRSAFATYLKFKRQVQSFIYSRYICAVQEPAPVIIDSINKKACGAENFIFKNKNYLFLGTNNHDSAAMYIAKNMHQLYELSGASTIDSIIVNSKVANVPTHRGGMGGQTPDNAATVHGFQVNDTSTTAPHNVHLYAFTGANGAILT